MCPAGPTLVLGGHAVHHEGVRQAVAQLHSRGALLAAPPGGTRGKVQLHHSFPHMGVRLDARRRRGDPGQQGQELPRELQLA